jgi:hypothetical protein
MDDNNPTDALKEPMPFKNRLLDGIDSSLDKYGCFFSFFDI